MAVEWADREWGCQDIRPHGIRLDLSPTQRLNLDSSVRTFRGLFPFGEKKAKWFC